MPIDRSQVEGFGSCSKGPSAQNREKLTILPCLQNVHTSLTPLVFVDTA